MRLQKSNSSKLWKMEQQTIGDCDKPICLKARYIHDLIGIAAWYTSA